MENPTDLGLGPEVDERAVRLVQLWRRPATIEPLVERRGHNKPFKVLYAEALDLLRMVEEVPGLKVTYTDQPAVQYRDSNVVVVPVTVQVAINRELYEQSSGAQSVEKLGEMVRTTATQVVRDYFRAAGVLAPNSEPARSR